MTVLAWLAEAAPHMAETGPLVALDHPVIQSAVDWLQVSLRIGEAAAPSTAREPANGRAAPPSAMAPARSPWAALAG
jgi:hypothetical protein